MRHLFVRDRACEPWHLRGCMRDLNMSDHLHEARDDRTFQFCASRVVASGRHSGNSARLLVSSTARETSQILHQIQRRDVEKPHWAGSAWRILVTSPMSATTPRQRKANSGADLVFGRFASITKVIRL